MLFFAITLLAIIFGTAIVTSILKDQDQETESVLILISFLIIGAYAILLLQHYSAINVGTGTIINRIELTNDKIIYKCNNDRFLVRYTNDPKKFKVGDTLWLNK